MLGFIWTGLFLYGQLSWLGWLGSPDGHHTIQGEPIVLQQDPQSCQVFVRLNQINERNLLIKPLIRLYPRDCAVIPVVGQPFSGGVRLRPIQGLANPGGFNLERWALGKGLSASGTLLSWQADGPAPTPGWRQRWLLQLRSLSADLPQAGLLEALIFGEQKSVDAATWLALREGGIIHLLAISGLHIGLAAMLGSLMGKGLMWLLPAKAYRHYFIPAGAIGLALAYTAMSGFGLPAQRALLMLVCWTLLRYSGRYWTRFRCWWACLTVLLMWDPWSLFNAGFWFSFLALGLLAFTAWGWRRGFWWRAQLLLTLGLLPLQWAGFGGVSVLSIPVNLLVVPLFSLLVIPLALLSGLLVPCWPALARLGLQAVDQCLNGLLWGLDWLQQVASGWVWLPGSGLLLYLLFLLMVFFGIFPGGRPLAWLAGVSMLLTLATPRPRWEVLLLDVGQGLSVLVRQGDRALLYDTGDAYPSGFNMAEAALYPVLRYEGIKTLDYLLVSHDDKDHAANWRRIRADWPVGHFISSAQLSPEVTLCQTGQHWLWGDLELQMLAPDFSLGGKANRDSCVLRVSDGRYSLLLPGDLPAEREERLLLSAETLSPVDWLVSAHHGSQHSSSARFLAALQPTEVLHSAGYANRWGFPRPEVLQRVAAVGARQWNTARQGMIRIRVGRDSPEISAWRPALPWYRDLVHAFNEHETWWIGR